MATLVRTEYPDGTEPVSTSYPYGEAKNVSAPGNEDGFPWEERFINDLLGFLQAVLVEAGTPPDGNPEQADASQYLSGLKTILAGVKIRASQAAMLNDDTLEDNDIVLMPGSRIPLAGDVPAIYRIDPPGTPNNISTFQMTDGSGRLARMIEITFPELTIQSSSTALSVIRAVDAGGTLEFFMSAVLNYFSPNSNRQVDLGATALRWRTLFAETVNMENFLLNGDDFTTAVNNVVAPAAEAGVFLAQQIIPGGPAAASASYTATFLLAAPSGQDIANPSNYFVTSPIDSVGWNTAGSGTAAVTTELRCLVDVGSSQTRMEVTITVTNVSGSNNQPNDLRINLYRLRGSY